MPSQWDYLLSERKPAPRAEPEPRRRRWLLALIAMVLSLIGIGTYGSIRGRGDVAKVKQLRQDLFASKEATPDQRKATAEQFREEMRKLSPTQRSELFVAGQREAIARLDTYFTMPPAERRQHLDREIARMEQRRQEWASRPPRTERRPEGNRTRSAEEIEQRRKQRLDRTTPEQRALMDQFRAKHERFRNDLNQRRAQRGLPPVSGFGRR